MALRIAEHIFTGLTSAYNAYDKTKTTLGKLIQQRTGVAETDKFAGPMPIGMGRPMESSTAIAVAYPHVVSWNETIDYVFLIENSTAASTRRIIMYNFDKATSVFTWAGFITVTFPAASSHTVRGFRMSRELYTTGTAAVNGTAVTGLGTAWTTSRMTVGSRIGFGSTDPTQITTWYEISAVGSNTGITLTASGGTIPDGPYVIEDLKAIISTTNTTATNGGLFLVSGLRFESFSVAGTTIPAGVSTDLIRAVYWLADASTVLNIAACGVAMDARESWTQQFVYVIDGTTTTCRVYKYNFRAALSGLASGKSTSAYVLNTAAQTPTGTASQANNGRIGTLNHGGVSINGVKSLYFVTTTRVYRADLNNVTSANSAWQSDAMVEAPPGGSATYVATSVLSSVEISDTTDRLIIMSTGAGGVRSYVTKYNTNSDPFDHIFLSDDKQLDQSTADSGGVAHPNILATVISVWSEGGVGYLCRNGTTSALNQIYAVPLAAHWTYAGLAVSQRLITPAMATPNAEIYKRVYISADKFLGDGTFGLAPEPYRAFYRTAGINDNSGSWTELDESGSLNSIAGSSEIQIMIEFKILGLTCIPARIFSVAVAYEDDSTDSHYQPSAGKSDLNNSRFAWRFSTAFGSTVPVLRVRLFDAVTGSELLDDDTSTSTAGTFEKSTDDGQTWGAYNDTDKGNNITYVRYTPSSMASNLKVRAVLTQYIP